MNKRSGIVAQLKADILSGQFGHYALPTRQSLAERFDVSVDVIREALAQLEVEGIIMKGKGRSMFPVPPRERINSNDQTFRDVTAAQGHAVKVEYVETPQIIEATPEIAREFRMAVGTPIIERKRRDSVDGVIYRYSRMLYLAELVSPEHLAGMQADYAYNVGDVIKAQRPLARIEERIFARVIADNAEAEILGTIKGAPVLERHIINYDEQLRVVWISIIIMNASYFEKRYDYAPDNEPKSTL